jgi:hypothetical protein
MRNKVVNRDHEYFELDQKGKRKEKKKPTKDLPPPLECSVQ